MRTITRPKRHTDACEGTAHCAHWYRPDRDCGQPTAAHSAFCAEHADQDEAPWMDHHDPEDCCPDHCQGEEAHE